jgi:2-succinyl-6-hydroxy-2,4-cyclohexadiene-1-carboxylate synthase
VILTFDQYRINTHIWGERTFQPILLLHGFLGAGNDWEQLAKRLSAQYYIIAPDIPGHGETIRTTPTSKIISGIAPYSMESVAQAMLGILDATGIETAYLCGYSMGARLALFLALRFPTRFRAVILLSGTAGLKTEEERTTRREHDERIAKQLETEPFPDFLQFWYNQSLFDSFRECPAFESITTKRVNANPHEAAQSLRSMGTGSQPPLWEELKQNHLPITFVAGEKDIKFVGLARELYAATPLSTLCIIPNAGHVLHHEAMQETYTFICQFCV